MNTYYFVSSKFLDGQTLYPRIPVTAGTREDHKIPRICVSKSLLGALMAIGAHQIYKRVYVYTCESNNVMTPTISQVFDQYITGEEWILEPAKLKLFKTLFLNKKEVNDEISYWVIHSKDNEIWFNVYDLDIQRLKQKT